MTCHDNAKCKTKPNDMDCVCVVIENRKSKIENSGREFFERQHPLTLILLSRSSISRFFRDQSTWVWYRMYAMYMVRSGPLWPAVA